MYPEPDSSEEPYQKRRAQTLSEESTLNAAERVDSQEHFVPSLLSLTP